MKKFKLAVVHAGFDKTGSTAIQSAMDFSREALLRNEGIAYLPGRWQAELGSYFSENPAVYVFNKLQKIENIEKIRQRDEAYIQTIEQWLDNIDMANSLVLSYEGFPGMDTRGLRMLREFALRYAEQARIVCYVRSPLSYAISGMSQQVKSGFRAIPPVTPFKTYLTKFIEAFGRDNVLVHPFERVKLIDGDAVIDFLVRFLDVPRSRAGAYRGGVSNENVSLSHDAVMFGNYLLEAAEQLGFDDIIESPAFHRKFARYLENFSGGGVRLTEDQIESVLTRSKEHLAFLKREFSIEFDESASSFLNKPEDRYSENEERRLREIAAMCIVKERDSASH